jgi:hypothetical protein
MAISKLGNYWFWIWSNVLITITIFCGIGYLCNGYVPDSVGAFSILFAAVVGAITSYTWSNI